MVYTKEFDCQGTNIPVLCAGDENSHSVVMVMHGLGSSAETQIPELERLEEQGFFALSFDAPHHGDRYDGLVGLIERSSGIEQFLLAMACEQQYAIEAAKLIKRLRIEYRKIAAMGISMGGFAVFALLRMHEKPDLFAPFLASPDFRYFNPEEINPVSPAESSGPANYTDDVFPESLFIVNAGKDTVVHTPFARKFYRDLSASYRILPDRLEYYEYPESDHIMRPDDWFDAWKKFIARLKREGF